MFVSVVILCSLLIYVSKKGDRQLYNSGSSVNILSLSHSSASILNNNPGFVFFILANLVLTDKKSLSVLMIIFVQISQPHFRASLRTIPAFNKHSASDSLVIFFLLNLYIIYLHHKDILTIKIVRGAQ